MGYILCEKPVSGTFWSFMLVQEHPQRQSGQQKQRPQPLFDREYGNAHKDEQHGPQLPRDAPTEVNDIKWSQKGDYSNEEEKDA